MEDMKEVIEEILKPEIKSIALNVIDIDEESVFVKIQDWRMRVYFEDKTINPMKYKGKLVKVEYIGDINDVFTLNLLSIK